jgi:hypothetical protein
MFSRSTNANEKENELTLTVAEKLEKLMKTRHHDQLEGITSSSPTTKTRS